MRQGNITLKCESSLMMLFTRRIVPDKSSARMLFSSFLDRYLVSYQDKSQSGQIAALPTGCFSVSQNESQHWSLHIQIFGKKNIRRFAGLIIYQTTIYLSVVHNYDLTKLARGYIQGSHRLLLFFLTLIFIRHHTMLYRVTTFVSRTDTLITGRNESL